MSSQIEYKSSDPTDIKVFKYFDYLDKLGNDETLELVFSKPLPPELLHLLHNMRTQAISDKLGIVPTGSDFIRQWAFIDGQVVILTTLIKAIEAYEQK